MKKPIERLIEGHIKDGMIFAAARMLKNNVGSQSPMYARLYILLLQMVVKLQQSVGPVSHDTYIELVTMNFPQAKDEKGGVFVE